MARDTVRVMLLSVLAHQFGENQYFVGATHNEKEEEKKEKTSEESLSDGDRSFGMHMKNAFPRNYEKIFPVFSPASITSHLISLAVIQQHFTIEDFVIRSLSFYANFGCCCSSSAPFVLLFSILNDSQIPFHVGPYRSYQMEIATHIVRFLKIYFDGKGRRQPSQL